MAGVAHLSVDPSVVLGILIAGIFLAVRAASSENRAALRRGLPAIALGFIAVVTVFFWDAPPERNGHLLLYLWLVPYLYVVFAPRQVALFTALMVAAATFVLARHAIVGHYGLGSSPALGAWITFVLTVLVVGLVTRRLTAALEESDRVSRRHAARSEALAEKSEALASLTERALVHGDPAAVRSDAERVLREILEVPVAVVHEGALADRPPLPPGTPSVASAPIRAAAEGGGQPEVVGAVIAAGGPEREFTRSERRFVGSVAAVVGAVIQRRRMEDRLEHAALHDPLTGLPNRALYPERLRAAIAHGRRAGTDVGVLLLDLDQFKLVNDSHGHAAGDALLMAVGQRLAGALRGEDTIVRLGGDEFAVVVQEVRDPLDAVTAAGHLRDALREPITVAGHRYFATVSIGVAYAGGREDDPGQVLREADAAMYRAKGRGRGLIEVYDETLRTDVVRRLRMETELRAAVDAGEVSVVFQPVVEPASGRIMGVEALARWTSEALGAVPPSEFIPVAEDSGLIGMLGEAVLRSALDAAVEWQRLRPGLGIAVNVSPSQLREACFTERVRTLAAERGVPLHTVSLEITEGLLVERDESTVANLRALDAAGAGLSVDDFGTGYSSLAQLRRLPLTRLKADRSFVDDEALLRATAELARTLGADVVAEGVETAEQCHRLLGLGYALAQGYLWSRPVEREAITAMLREDRAVA